MMDYMMLLHLQPDLCLTIYWMLLSLSHLLHLLLYNAGGGQAMVDEAVSRHHLREPTYDMAG